MEKLSNKVQKLKMLYCSKCFKSQRHHRYSASYLVYFANRKIVLTARKTDAIFASMELL